MSTDDEVMGAPGARLVRKVADLTAHVVEWVLGDRSAQRASDVRACLRDIERAVTGEARPCGTTHHLGCACYEAAHRARAEALEAEVARLRRSPASATLSAHDHVRELVAERDEARAEAARLRAAAQDLLDADADVPLGETVSVEAVNRHARKVLARKALVALLARDP